MRKVFPMKVGLGRVVCVDAEGTPTLTEGRWYDLVKAVYGPSSTVLLVDNDKGEMQGFDMRRFMAVPDDGAVLAYNEVCED